jgi:hypothetical protein
MKCGSAPFSRTDDFNGTQKTYFGQKWRKLHSNGTERPYCRKTALLEGCLSQLRSSGSVVFLKFKKRPNKVSPFRYETRRETEVRSTIFKDGCGGRPDNFKLPG